METTSVYNREGIVNIRELQSLSLWSWKTPKHCHRRAGLHVAPILVYILLLNCPARMNNLLYDNVYTL